LQTHDKEKPPALRTGVDRVGITAPVSQNALDSAFTLRLFAREFARTADRFGLLSRFLDGRFLEMLLELHFTENAFALELFLQGTECLFDVIVADADLHVVVTTFLS
jgi:hypothetical protein